MKPANETARGKAGGKTTKEKRHSYSTAKPTFSKPVDLLLLKPSRARRQKRSWIQGRKC